MGSREILAVSALVLSFASGSGAAAFELHSADITPNGTIAKAQIYTRCGGQNISPALSWSGAPSGTKSFVLTVIDHDVKPSGWTHWIVTGLPPNATSLDRGATHLPNGATVVTSDLGPIGYGGPCPPIGSGLHRYVFKVWALPTATLTVTRKAPPLSIEANLAKQALAQATFIGTVRR